MRLFVLPSLIILSALVGLRAPAQTPAPLVVGQAVERELQAGETHRYAFVGLAGQYLHVVVLQKGVRLTAAVLTQTGAHVASGDRANWMYGPKSIHLVSDADTEYILQIEAIEGAPQGRYTAQLTTARPASPRARQLVEAQTVFSTAFALAQTVETRAQAPEKYLAALQLYRAAGDPEGEAMTLTELGLVTYFLGARRQSIDWYRQAVPVWRSFNDQYGEARAVNNLGVSHADLGELPESREYYQQALPLWRALGDLNGQARTLNNLSAIHFLLGEWQAGLDLSQQALDLWRTAGDRSSEPFALNTLGLLFFELGDPAQALEYQQQALTRVRAATPKTTQLAGLEARVLNNIGEVFIARREETQALRYLNEALTLRRQLADKQSQAMTLTNLGYVHNFAGRRAEALASYEAALQLARETSYRFVEATILKKLGELFAQTDPPKARESLRASLALFHAAAERDAEAEVLHFLARVERALGDTAAARAHLEESLKLTEGLRTKVGSLNERALFFARKQDYFTTYIDLLMQEHALRPDAGDDRLALQTNERARARSLLELLTEARAEVQRGAPPELLARLQALRALIVGKTDRLLRLKGNQAPAEQLTSLETEIRQVTVEYEDAQAQLRQHPRYAALTQPQPLQLAEMQTLLDPQTLLLQYALGPERSYLWVVSRDGLQSHVLPGRAEIETAADEVHELLTAPQPRPGETFAQRAARIKAAETLYWPAAARLSQMLLGPLAATLNGQRLVIVPDGALHAVSFSALPQPVTTPTATPQPLIAQHEIAYLPSASVLAVQRRERRAPAPQTVAVFADPVFAADDFRVASRGNTPKTIRPTAKLDLAAQLTRSVPAASWLREEIALPRLQNSRGELEAIAALVPRGRALIARDFAANRAAALDPKLKQYRIIHFATHALVNDEHPVLSGIVLSLVNPDGSPRAGFLQLHDVYNLDLAAELVVLSACQTARGQTVKGEGVIGLTRGFLYSGAQRVVASLWAVDDTATRQLMEQFYRGMLQQKLSPAAALRQAQLALWRQRPAQSPYYWSAFALYGEWR